MSEHPRHTLPDSVWKALSRWSLILEQDKVLPSVVAIVAGGPINGSWWGNPTASGTYEALQALDQRPDVLSVKLVSGKVTFVLERLWPEVLAVGQAREAWQLNGLTAEASSLLKLVDGTGSIQLDELPGPSKTLRESARELKRRLLVHGYQVHTQSGAHAKVLESWTAWAEKTRPPLNPVPLPAAKQTLQDIVAALNSYFGAKALLPWQRRSALH